MSPNAPRKNGMIPESLRRNATGGITSSVRPSGHGRLSRYAMRPSVQASPPARMPVAGSSGPLPRTARNCARSCPTCDDAVAPPCSPTTAAPRVRAGRLPWADLLRRVFADDVLQCVCGGRRSVIAVVTDPTVARALLAVLDLSCEPATFAPARDPPGRARVERTGVVLPPSLARQAPVCPRAIQTSVALHPAPGAPARAAGSHGGTGIDDVRSPP